MEGESWQRGLSSFAEEHWRTWLAQHKWVHKTSLTPLMFILLPKVINTYGIYKAHSVNLAQGPVGIYCLAFQIFPHSTSNIAHFGDDFAHTFIFPNQRELQKFKLLLCLYPRVSADWHWITTMKREPYKISSWVSLSPGVCRLSTEKGFCDGSCCPNNVPTSCPVLSISTHQECCEMNKWFSWHHDRGRSVSSFTKRVWADICMHDWAKEEIIFVDFIFTFYYFFPIKVTYHMELCFVIIPFLPREGFWIIQESQSWPGPLFTWHLSSPSLRQPPHSLSSTDCGPPSPSFSQLSTPFKRGWRSLAFLGFSMHTSSLQGGRALLVVPQDDRGVGHVWRGAEHWLRHWGAGYRTARGHRVSERRRRRQGRRIFRG